MKQYLSMLLLCLCVATVASAQSKWATLEKRAEETNSEALIVMDKGQIVVERYWGKGRPGKKIETMSCTKSIVSLGIGTLVSDGLLHLDSAVCKYYPEWRQGRKKLITVRMLLNHTSGLQDNPNAGVEVYPSKDIVQLALTAELAHDPGTRFFYNNKATNLLAGIVEKVSGKRMDMYIGERLFAPMGITNSYWFLESDLHKDLGKPGAPFAMAGCQLQPRDFLKIGQLVLSKGQWNGKPLISEAYMKECMTPQPIYKAYGLLWWLLYDKTISVISDEKIAELQKINIPADFLEKVKKIKGAYPTDEAYTQAVESVFGPAPWGYLSRVLGTVRLREQHFGNLVAYSANGYLGNYLLIEPDKQRITLRMISHDNFRNEQDGFSDFEKTVLAIQ